MHEIVSTVNDHSFSKYAKCSGKTNIYLPIRTRLCAFQDARNVSFSGKFCLSTKWVIPSNLTSSQPAKSSEIQGGKHCFWLIMHGFCSSNALYWEVFHLQCLFFDSLWYLRLLLFQIKSKPGVAFWVLLLEKSMFLFIPFFIGVILAKECCRKLGIWKKGRWGGGGGGPPHIGRIVYTSRGFKPAHYVFSRIQ